MSTTSRSAELANLLAAVSKAQAVMPQASFDSTNPFLKNRYASLGAVIEISRPVLAANGLALTQWPISEQTTIGLESILSHSSGEWIASSVHLEIGEEKGKSRAQVAGSILTYLRRYAWASILGIYADEDTDGNHPAPRMPQERPVAPPPPKGQPGPASRAPTPPASGTTPPGAAPEAPKAASEATLAWMVTELDKFFGADGMGQVEEYLQKAGIILPTEVIADTPLRFVPTSREQLNMLKGAIGVFIDGGEAEQPAYIEKRPMKKAIEVPRDPKPVAPPPTDGLTEDHDSPDAPWRSFPMPWGKLAGAKLADLDKKYLFGLWANYVVELEYNGKPKSPQAVEKDKVFRSMLDEAGRHYEFTKND